MRRPAIPDTRSTTYVVGNTLLRQQVLLTISNLPSIIARLREEDLSDIADARNGMASSKKNTPPKVGRKKDEGNAGAATDEAQEVSEEVEV